MERELAERMIAALRSLNPGLDEATAITRSKRDQAEAGLIRGHLGQLMAGPLFDLTMHIVRQYPDLDPDAAAESI